jgi:glucokinase
MTRNQMPSHRSLTVTDTVNANLQNRINISIIFNYLRGQGSAYRAQIARDLGLSAPAVSRAVEKLRNDRYVIESERRPVENGKRAAHISINAGRGYVVGVDLLADPLSIAVSDFSGTILSSYTGTTKPEGMSFADYLLHSIDASLEDSRRKASGHEVKVLAIGIGVPAVIDPRTGMVLRASLYDEIAQTNVRAEVQARFPVPIYLENIANLAAIGEWKRGVNRNVRNMLFIEIGNGIGAGIILDGNLYRGSDGSAGEMGYSLTGLDALGFDSSAKGFLESRASMTAISNRVAKDEYLSAAALCEAAHAGREPASGFVREMVRHLAVSTVNAMLLLNPELVVVGGSIFELPFADELLLQPLISDVEKSYPFSPVKIQRTSLGAKVNIIGAVQFALDSLLVDEYPYRL